MKLKDLFKMVEGQNEFNKFMNNIDRKVVKIDEYGCRDKEFKSVNEFVKFFKEQFYGELTKDTELVNENGYIKFSVDYQEKNWDAQTGIYYQTRTYEYNLYIDEVQEWN